MLVINNTIWITMFITCFKLQNVTSDDSLENQQRMLRKSTEDCKAPIGKNEIFQCWLIKSVPKASYYITIYYHHIYFIFVALFYVTQILVNITF